MIDAAQYSEMSLIQAMKVGMLTYADFVIEMRRRIAAGEQVHPYHAKCAAMGAA